MSAPGLRIAYLSLQATTQGQASHAHVHEIIAGLRDAGHAVTLHEPAYAGERAPGALGRLAEFARIERRLVREIRTDAYDVLYVRGHALAWPVSVAARRAGVTVVQECNGPYADFFAMWPAARFARPLIEYLARSQFAGADALIAVTPELAAWLERETGRPAEVIGNGANEHLFSPDAVNRHAERTGDRYAVFFGALSPWQGVDALLHAIESPAWPGDVKLVIVGDGALASDVAQVASRAPALVWLGRLPYGEVGGVVAGAMCAFVLAARGDSGFTGSPLKMYEAMACGVPIVVSDVPTTADAVREFGCGVVLADHSPETIARAVSGIAEGPDDAAAMGAAGRQAIVTNFTWARRAEATERIVSLAAARDSDTTATRHQGE